MNFNDYKFSALAVAAGLGLLALSVRVKSVEQQQAVRIDTSTTAGTSAAETNYPNNPANRAITLPNSATQPKAADRRVKAPRTVSELVVPAERALQLTGVVGPNTEKLIQQLKELNDASSDPIYLLINSPGGSVLSGGLLISAIQASKAPVITVCTAVCASMAFITLEYGTKRYAVDRSIIMSHPASVGGNGGELDKAVSFLGTLQRYVDKHNHYIANRVGMDYSEFKNKSSIELWMDAEDAASTNFLDGVVYLSIDGLLTPSEGAAEESLYKIPSKFDDTKLNK